uniref:TIR domain-containing protein n=1 Tax=Brassica oleracea var. oleracea TaxID=109376 RepID=A0A0D3DQ24_BRAOL
MPSSPSLRGVNYDVFLSFRGADTRKNIISHLHKELLRQGIRTFKDDRTLEMGDCVPRRLREAIKTSRFAIVVISKNYGTSSWCLEELRMIMKLELDKKIVVIPVFYDVDISDVRNHRRSFALIYHHQSPKIPSWKEALQRIANTQATESRKCKDDATMVEGVVERVSNMLLSMLPMDIGDIVGMEAHMQQIEHLLDMDFTTNEVRMVGIWGMVGIGKTTIAKNFYEKHKHHFKTHHCFMEGVSSLKKHGPLFLQKQLLSNILGKEDFKSLSLGQGATCIQSRLVNLKSLIVIDDVDDVKQLDALAKEASWFGSGSRIIITTQDKSLLNSSCAVYKVEYVKDDKALQIFQRIAFQGAKPPIVYKDLSISISELAQGLPFALEAFGVYLRGKSVVEWRDALKSFEEALPENIMMELRSSYDGLDKPGRRAFLHVACLFNGEPVRRVRKLLGQGKDGMRVLEEKSLIRVSADGRIAMHCLLEQMGKQIVRQDSDNSPAHQRILWHHHDIRQVLANKTETLTVLPLKGDFEFPRFPNKPSFSTSAIYLTSFSPLSPQLLLTLAAPIPLNPSAADSTISEQTVALATVVTNVLNTSAAASSKP